MKKTVNLADKEAARELLKQVFGKGLTDDKKDNTTGMARTSSHSRVVEHAPIVETPFL